MKKKKINIHSRVIRSLNVYQKFVFVYLLFFVFSFNIFGQSNNNDLATNFLTGTNQDYTKVSFKRVIEAHNFANNLVTQINNYNLNYNKQGEKVQKIEILHVGKKLPKKLITIANRLYIDLNRNIPEGEKIKIDIALVNPNEQDLNGTKSINDFLGDIEGSSLRLSSEINDNNLILRQDNSITNIDIKDSFKDIKASRIKNFGSSIKNLFGMPDGLSFIAIKRVKRTKTIKKSEFSLAVAKTAILTVAFYSVLGEKFFNGEIHNLVAPLVVSAIDLFVFTYWQRHRLSFLKQGVEPFLSNVKNGVSYFKFSHNKVFHFVGAFALSALVRVSMLSASFICIDGVRDFFYSPSFSTLSFSFAIVFTGLWASTQSAFSKIIPEIIVTRFKKNVLDKMTKRSFAEHIYTGTLFSVGLLSTFAVVVGALFDASDVAKYALLSVGIMGGFIKLWELIGGHDKMFKFKETIKKILSSIKSNNNNDKDGDGDIFNREDIEFAEGLLLDPLINEKSRPFLLSASNLSNSCYKMLSKVSSLVVISF